MAAEASYSRDLRGSIEVEFMYTKEVAVSWADLVDLLGTSDYFQAVLLFIWNDINRLFIRHYNRFFIRNYINRFFIRNYSVADPGCLSRIPDPDFYPSRIPDRGPQIQKQQQMRGVKKNLLSYLFF